MNVTPAPCGTLGWRGRDACCLNGRAIVGTSLATIKPPPTGVQAGFHLQTRHEVCLKKTSETHDHIACFVAGSRLRLDPSLPLDHRAVSPTSDEQFFRPERHSPVRHRPERHLTARHRRRRNHHRRRTCAYSCPGAHIRPSLGRALSSLRRRITA